MTKVTFGAEPEDEVQALKLQQEQNKQERKVKSIRGIKAPYASTGRTSLEQYLRVSISRPV